MSLDESVAEFERRAARARAMGSSRRLMERAATGILNARQRIDYLIEPASFEEFGLFAASLDLNRSEEHTSELQSLMRIPYAVFCLKKTNKKMKQNKNNKTQTTDT